MISDTPVLSPLPPQLERRARMQRRSDVAAVRLAAHDFFSRFLPIATSRKT
jgi:hypothetical protein